jgi:hypothetical protein
MKKLYAILFIVGAGMSFQANAWFFFFLPIPTAMPNALSNLIQKLTDSNQTKALAYVGEDKVFGQKYYVWGSYIGDLSQKEAVKLALERCNRSFDKAKNEMIDGVPRWNFGDKKCELYGFPQLPETAIMPNPADDPVPEVAPTADKKWVEPGTELPYQLNKPSANSLPITPTAVKLLESKPLVAPAPVVPISSSEGGKRLLELKSLLDQGVITQQDYDTKKSQILKSM